MQLFYLDDPACGGALIDKRTILSAAHCFEPTLSGKDGDPRKWTFSIGTLEKLPRHVEQIAKIIMHQRYSKDPETNYNDIALLKTRLPVQFSDIVQPVPLPRPLVNIIVL